MLGVSTDDKRSGVSTVEFCWVEKHDEFHADPLTCDLRELLVQPRVSGVELNDDDVSSVFVYCHEVS